MNRGLIYKTFYCFSRAQNGIFLHKRYFKSYNKKDTPRLGLQFSVRVKNSRPILTVFYVPALGDWVPILDILASSSPMEKGLNSLELQAWYLEYEKSTYNTNNSSRSRTVLVSLLNLNAGQYSDCCNINPSTTS